MKMMKEMNEESDIQKPRKDWRKAKKKRDQSKIRYQRFNEKRTKQRRELKRKALELKTRLKKQK